MKAVDAQIFQCAVSNSSGRAVMHDDRESRMASVEASDEGDVEVSSLENVLVKAGGVMDLLKLDCDGSEWDILAAHECYSKINRIRMEYHLTIDKTLEDLKGITGSLGYVIEHLRSHGNHGIAWLPK